MRYVTPNENEDSKKHGKSNENENSKETDPFYIDGGLKLEGRIKKVCAASLL